MRRWLEDDVIAHGRLPLLCFLLGFMLGFVVIRVSVRLIRANVRWWPGNIKAGDTHIHHMVFGVVTVLLSGLGLIATAEDSTQVTSSVLAALFGIGAALVLDEFALIFYLRDVYWSEQGRTSVDAVFVAFAVTGLLLLGVQPSTFLDYDSFRQSRGLGVRIGVLATIALNLVLAGVVIAKGKIWTGLFGMFFTPLLLIGAIRLSRPSAPWARWRYGNRPKTMTKAVNRERTLRRPVIRAKIFIQDLIAGKPDVAHAKTAAEAELQRTVVPAPSAPVPHPHLLPRRRADATADSAAGE
ncbi:hypothetical protein [Nocardia asteroides]|uniref:Integral membrane protein n=1 Tax=Nocardia asteroides NBRC 15531 TaxID=1110697 RepID=U5E9T6_NOCAS|nr:hypothetical protein [Nocardia asteroides]TLF64658.1 hypothetical protein FEK33_23990 [Nocardia asteroides NBRC 15531]UGT50222.1 hypothetical protein LT345_06455 [Nocardia asteroides]SFN15040.1 hypothetical protein SAMN05444423_106294 [Nocardia asteroides]VEG37005.1 Uncharacterised protein [Nocardia asteroides]GAD81939.1 hypothetical protein NCAST_05_03760 [Nocardia asteroides NBRC 15531]